jgi:hypothetical protein
VRQFFVNLTILLIYAKKFISFLLIFVYLKKLKIDIMSFNEVKNFINGEFKSGSSTKIHSVISPLDGEKLTTFNESTMEYKFSINTNSY